MDKTAQAILNGIFREVYVKVCDEVPALKQWEFIQPNKPVVNSNNYIVLRPYGLVFGKIKSGKDVRIEVEYDHDGFMAVKIHTHRKMGAANKDISIIYKGASGVDSTREIGKFRVADPKMLEKVIEAVSHSVMLDILN